MLLPLSDTKISFTEDAWSDTSAGISLLSLTCHAINSEFERVELALGADPLDERHNGEYISRTFDEMLLRWKINAKIIQAVMRYSGANMKELCFSLD